MKAEEWPTNAFVFAKFVLFYVFCSVAFALFKVMYYNISKNGLQRRRRALN